MSWWRAVKKKGNKAEILVMGDIGASWWASVNTQQIRKELAEFDDVFENRFSRWKRICGNRFI